MTFDIGPADEELLDPGRDPDRGRTRRLRLDLTVAAVLLVGVLLVGRALSKKDTAAPAPSRSPSQLSLIGPTQAPTTPIVPAPSSVTVTASDGVATVVPALPPRNLQNLGACPVNLSCFSTADVAHAVEHAVRDAFPTARITSSTTVRLLTNPWAGALWFRQLNATVGRAELLVRVTPTQAADPVDRGTSAGIVFYGTAVGQYSVTAQVGVHAPAGALAKLAQLAHDARLLSTGGTIRR